jgi:hypothetical protein
VVVLKNQAAAFVAGLEPDGLRLEVDLLDAADIQRYARNHATNGADRVKCVDVTRDDLRQQRLEGEVILAADESHLDVGQARFTKAAHQVLSRVNAGEATAKDKDFLTSHTLPNRAHSA